MNKINQCFEKNIKDPAQPFVDYITDYQTRFNDIYTLTEQVKNDINEYRKDKSKLELLQERLSEIEEKEKNLKTKLNILKTEKNQIEQKIKNLKEKDEKDNKEELKLV